MTKPGSPNVLVMCDGDPDADGLFSGAAKYLTRALERRGLVIGKGDVSGAPGFWERRNLLTRIARRADRFHFEARSRWSANSFARKTSAADALALRYAGANACLMFGTTYNPRVEMPTYCYLDATVQQVRDARAWEFRYFDDAFADAIQAYQQRVFDRCACIFTFSEWAAASVRDDYNIESDRVMTVGGGSNFAVPPLPHGRYDAQRILFVGKDFERKGGPLVVDAFRKLRQTLPRARLVIAGCDPGVREPGVEIAGFVSKNTVAGERRLLEL